MGVDNFPDLPVGFRGAPPDDKIKLPQLPLDIFNERCVAVGNRRFTHAPPLSAAFLR